MVSGDCAHAIFGTFFALSFDVQLSGKLHLQTPTRYSMTNNSSHDTISHERRRILAAMLAGGAGLATIGHEERILAETLSQPSPLEQCTPPAHRAIADWAQLDALKRKMPMSKIGNVELSRMILGGNLIGGWAHSRDLLYLSDLVKAYHTREKIYETFQIAEACGVNTFLSSPGIGKELIAYREKTGGNMQFIGDTGNDDKTIADAGVKGAVDAGASLIYVLGEATDRYYLREEEKFDLIGKCLQRIRDEGYPAGIGAHRVEACQKCIELGLVPDFWVLTYHHLNYWSAVPGKQEHDNVFCRQPEVTEAFMRERPEPWIAFKTLAAGALQPHEGFRFAFEGGADFICVGMYDFQVVEDVNICTDILGNGIKRKRPWITEDIAVV